MTPWTVGRQAPLSIGSPRQEYWSGLSFSPPGDLPDPGIEPRSAALRAYSLPSEPPGKPWRKAVCFTKHASDSGQGERLDKPSFLSLIAVSPTCSPLCLHFPLGHSGSPELAGPAADTHRWLPCVRPPPPGARPQQCLPPRPEGGQALQATCHRGPPDHLLL